MTRAKNRNREIEAERKHEAWELRLRGRTYRDIGKAMGIGHETARRWIQEVMDQKSLPLASEVRKQELERMTRYLDKLDAKIEMGDLNAISLAVKVSESIRKLLGADMPVTANIQVDHGASTELEIMSLIRDVRARNQVTLERIARAPVAEIEAESVPEAEIVD